LCEKNTSYKVVCVYGTKKLWFKHKNICGKKVIAFHLDSYLYLFLLSRVHIFPYNACEQRAEKD
jgi:hypothetical protein